MIRHVIVFNAAVPEEQVREMADRGKRELGGIPGVTDVRFGIAVENSPPYRYLFDIGFADEAAMEGYRLHPHHISFADRHFRPMAQDRITIDYRLE